jgi:TolA-binding protein
MCKIVKYLSLILLVIIPYLPSFAQSTLAFQREEEVFNTALELFHKGEYAAARESFEDFLNLKNPDLHNNSLQREDALYYRALSALNLFHEDAEDLLLTFVEKHSYHPKTVQALYVLGNHYFRQKNYKKAVQYYEKLDAGALSADERDEMRFKAGYANFSQRKFDAALEYFNQLKRTSRKYASASSYYSGFIEFETGEYDKAYADLVRAEESEAYAAVVPYMIANVLYKQQRYKALLDYINKVETRPNLSQKGEIALLKAEAYYHTNDYQNAAMGYRKYSESQRNNIEPQIAFRYGRSLYSTNAYEEAIDPLRKAAASRDSVAGFAAYFLGLSYLKENRKNEALTAFDQAVKLNRKTSVGEESLMHFAKVNLELDQTRQAITAFEQFLDNYPSSKHQREASDLLSQSYLSTNDYQLALDYLSARRNLTTKMEQVYQQASFLQGVQYFNANRYPQAIQMFRKSLEKPRDPETEAKARLWLAEAYSVDRRYDEAIDQYLRVLGNRQLQNQDVIQQARYGLGYAYYNTNDYNRALVNFKSYVNASNARKYPHYQDAMLRLADSYYATKSYNEAIAAYNTVLSMPGKSDQDYAYLQKGIVSGISGNYEQAITAFDQVINNFSSSRYYDDAIFQKGQLNLEEGRYEQAIDNFSRLIREKSTSRLIPYALIKRASAYYNRKEYEQARKDYVAVINDYVSHSAAKQVLLPLQEVLDLLNQGAQFDQYFARYKNAHPDEEGLEMVEYETAKNMYFNQDYDKAIRHLQSFIENYPQDSRTEEARYYLAESYYRKNEYRQALDEYRKLVNSKDFGQRNRVINRIADINFQMSNYAQAVIYFKMLEQQAANKKELYNAMAGMMESYYHLGSYDSAKLYADKVLEKALVNAGAKNHALLFKGKASMAKGEFEEANALFQEAIDNARDANAAEAGFLIGQILHQQKKYKKSIERLISFASNFSSYDEWVGKSYLLIADNYIALKDYFQAKGTLQSLIEHFPKENVKARAREKLKEVEKLQQQAAEQKPVTDSLEVDIKEIGN